MLSRRLSELVRLTTTIQIPDGQPRRWKSTAFQRIAQTRAIPIPLSSRAVVQSTHNSTGSERSDPAAALIVARIWVVVLTLPPLGLQE